LTWFERAFWFVDTTVDYGNGHNYVPENDGENGKPEKLIDSNNSTYLMMVKPGKPAYNGHKHPDGAEYGFIIDLGGLQEFNLLKWRHRNTNTNFQAFKIKVSGSDDKVNYTVLEESMATKSTSNVEIELPLSGTYTHRYIKVEYTDYDPTNGSNLCVAEFNVGKK